MKTTRVVGIFTILHWQLNILFRIELKYNVRVLLL